MTALTCTCCGRWRVEAISLNGVACYKVTRNRTEVVGGRPWPRTPEQVVALLQRYGGPSLDRFE